MNWKLIFSLSLFGLAMGVGSVFVIPSKIEPAFWLAIFLISAVVIARTVVVRRFLHGLMVGLVNCFWIIAAHILFFPQYSATHQQEIAMMQSGAMAQHPRLMIAVFGSIVGVVSGAVIGLLALLAGKLLKPRVSTVV